MRKLLNLFGSLRLTARVLLPEFSILLMVILVLFLVIGNAQRNSGSFKESHHESASPLKVQSPARHGSGDRAGASTFTAASTTIPEPLMTCESLGMLDKKHWWRVRNCKIAEGHTIDEVLNNLMERQDQYAHCGDFGPWILDQDGNIMGRYRNPPCPKGSHAN